MIVGSIKEDATLDKRISITPETSKNLNDLGLKIYLESKYAEHLGISDEKYSNVKFFDDPKELTKNIDLLAQVNCPSTETIKNLKENSIILGILNPNKNKKILNNFLKQKINPFSLELLPRITRAQSMDVLSSQANLAGYRAVIESIYEFEKAIPMMMTAAGTAPLDDANVTRFCGLLDDLTKITNTKFIIITHHALTMSRMDRLYGVTMAEQGVSQLVSVDLQRAEELVA